ncbi:MAG: hypothetical protein WDN69_15255 [Aliidongia sp.]
MVRVDRRRARYRRLEPALYSERGHSRARSGGCAIRSAAALDGGADGLDAYRRLAPEFARILRPGGLAAFEVGAGQAPAVTELCRAARLYPLEIRADLAGIGRVVVARNQDPLK